MRVLSLFDGYAGAFQALKNVGIKVETYYASEIDKHAMQIAKQNHPEIIYLGDVKNVDKDFDGLENIDLMIGGSPCQGFSFAGKQLNFEDPRSKLFFEFVRLLKEVKPRYFLLENVKMKKEYQDVISRELGVNPIAINSALLSAQNRQRLYWTNIPFVDEPNDKGILLKDIVHEKDSIGVLKNLGTWRVKNDKANCIDASYHKGVDNHAQRTQVLEGKPREIKNLRLPGQKAGTLCASMWKGSQANGMTNVISPLTEYIVPFDKTLKILEQETERGKIGYFKTNSQGNRVYSIHKKSVALCGEAGGKFAKTGGYLFGCITPDRVNKRQNGQRFNDGKKFYTLTAQDQHGVLIEGYIRKLTPVECERLQTRPDSYTEGVSNTQRYKMLGNGFTVAVIEHILSYLLLEDF